MVSVPELIIGYARDYCKQGTNTKIGFEYENEKTLLQNDICKLFG